VVQGLPVRSKRWIKEYFAGSDFGAPPHILTDLVERAGFWWSK
jgi:hypothetical protein